MDFNEILRLHASRYPGMKPRDAVKLAFQSVMGGGHMIPSPELAMRRLADEYASVTNSRELRVEPLGEYSRVHLDCELTELELSLIGRIFVESANFPCETEGLESRLERLENAAREGIFGFDSRELDAYLAEYRAEGCPAVSHSDAYRELYAPSYRVIDSRYARLLPLVFAIGHTFETKSRVVVAIDGRAASGKSTAAELLTRLFGGDVIHADDFFLPYEMRTPERLAEPGGNLDRERFKAEVVASLPGGGEHRIFDCSSGGFKPETKRFSGEGLLVVEGCYSLHPEFGWYCDLAAFLTLEPEEQRHRILARNGEAMLERFIRDWIPMEERYFTHFEIESLCDFVL